MYGTSTLPSYFLSDHRIYLCIKEWIENTRRIISWNWTNKQLNWRNFFVKLFVYLKKRKTILHVHEYRLWVVVVFFFCPRFTQSVCVICTKKTFSTRFKWFVKEYRHSLWWVNVFITLQFLVKSINLLPIIAVNESAHVAKQEPSAFEILALDGIYCRRRIDGGRQRDKKVNLSHVLAGTCRKLIHRRVRVSRCELLTQGQLEVIGMHD